MWGRSMEGKPLQPCCPEFLMHHYLGSLRCSLGTPLQTPCLPHILSQSASHRGNLPTLLLAEGEGVTGTNTELPSESPHVSLHLPLFGTPLLQSPSPCCRAPLLPPPTPSSSKLLSCLPAPAPGTRFQCSSISTSRTYKKFIQKRAQQLKKADKAENDGPIVDLLRPFIYPMIKVVVIEVSNSAEEHCCVEEGASEVGGSWSLHRHHLEKKEKVLEKGGSVSAYGDPSGVAFVITVSLTVLFPEWGLCAFSGLGNQWYFGLHFISFVYFFFSFILSAQRKCRLDLN